MPVLAGGLLPGRCADYRRRLLEAGFWELAVERRRGAGVVRFEGVQYAKGWVWLFGSRGRAYGLSEGAVKVWLDGECISEKSVGGKVDLAVQRAVGL